MHLHLKFFRNKKILISLSILALSYVITIRRKKVMQYLLLIYENEKRFSKGFPEAELAEYRAFGKQFAAAIKGGNALQPTGSAATVRVRDGKGSRSYRRSIELQAFSGGLVDFRHRRASRDSRRSRYSTGGAVGGRGR